MPTCHQLQSLSMSLNTIHRIYTNSTLYQVAYIETDANYRLCCFKGMTAPIHFQHINLDIIGGERIYVGYV